MINYQGTEIDFTPPWRRMTMIECVKEYTGVDFNTIETDEEALEIAKEKGYRNNSWNEKRRSYKCILRRIW